MQQKDVAIAVGVSEQTVSGWKKKYGWDEQIRSEEVSIQTSINTLRRKFNEWVSNIDKYDTSVADAALKHAKTISMLDDSIDPLAATLMVMEAFAAYIEMHHSDKYTDFQELLPGFLSHMRNRVEV